MGILSNLFKQKSTKATSERPEGRPASALSAFAGRSPRDTEKAGIEPVADPVPEADSAAQQEAPQKNISFSRSKDNVPGVKSVTRNLVPVKTPEVSEKQISIDFDDVRPQIPAGLLKPSGGETSKAKLVFNTYELLPGLSQGKATASVARIVQLAPDLFNAEPPPADSTVELPLKKIVAQIGVFPGRPDQVDEIFPPLDARYASLVTEKDAPRAKQADAPAEPQPVQEPVAPEAMAPSPAVESQPEPEPASAAAPVEIPAAEASVNGSANGNHVEPGAEAETVSYSLASIFQNVPEAWLDGKLKSVDRAIRITVPFDLVEAQIASGRVELPFADFFRALPENLKEHFSSDKDRAPAKVLVPLNEVFQNLPGVEPLPQPSPSPVAPEPEPEAELAAPAAEKISAEPEAVVEPLPVEEIHEAVVAAEPVSEHSPESELLPPLPEPAPAPQAVIPEEVPTAQTEKAEEPQPAGAAPEPQPEPESPKVEEPEPVAAHAEPAQTNGNGDLQFITPSIQVCRMAPPPISTRLSFAPEPEQTEAAQPAAETTPAPAHAQQETAEPEKPAAAQEPVAVTAETESTPVSITNITNFIVSDGKLDTRKTVEHVIMLPGITAAALIIKGKARTAGEFPKNLHAYETGKGLFQTFEGHSAKAAAAAPRPSAVTLHLDNFSGTWFKQNGIMLCVLHPERALDAAAHSAVMLVVQEIVRLRQH